MKPGEVIQGKYRLDQRLGVGGMGEVWRATHTGTGREFAVKFMHAHIAASPVARDRFAREARASAQINHPSIVDIFDVGEHDGGTLYLVMELLSGMLLVDALAGDPRLSVRDFLAVMHDVAEALGAAHAAGVVHRDIKPENIFLHRDRATGVSVPRILDFGIGKFAGGSGSNATATGALLGSPRYMSPEQTRSATSADGRADLWSCGVILFEGLTGTWPHEGDSFSSLVLAICTTPPASIDTLAPSLPESLRSIVRGCLEPVERRIADAGELAARLAIVLEDPALARTTLPRPLASSGPSATTTGLRFRTSGGALSSTATPAPIRAQLRSSPSAVVPAPASVEPKFRPVDRTIPLHAEAQAQLQSYIRAATGKQPGAFVPLAQTAKLDPSVVVEAARLADVKRAADAASALRAEASEAARAPALQPQSFVQQPLQPQPFSPHFTAAPPGASQAYPVALPPARSGGGLRITAAVLAILLVGIIAALIVTVRSPPSGSVPSAAPAPPSVAPSP